MGKWLAQRETNLGFLICLACCTPGKVANCCWLLFWSCRETLAGQTGTKGVPRDQFFFEKISLGIPCIEYFPKVFFWTSWSPWASLYLQMFSDPPKNLNIFSLPPYKGWPHKTLKQAFSLLKSFSICKVPCKVFQKYWGISAQTFQTQ